MTWNEIPTILDENMTDVLDRAGVDRAALVRLDLDTISVDDLAAWLRDHSLAHLSEIERIELVERLTRRRFLIGAGVLGLGVITGCGPEEEAIVPTATTGETRTVEHALGTTEVPMEPQNIITLDAQSLGFLVALNEMPTASCTTASDEFPKALTPLVEGQVSSLGDCFSQIPYERIAAADPDLIIGYATFMESADSEAYTRLSTIAPTVGITFDQFDRVGPIMDFGHAVGKTDEAEARLEEFNAFIEQSAQQIGRNSGTVAVIEASMSETFTLYSDDFYFCSLVARLGFAFAPTAQQIEGYNEDSARVSELSLEQITLLEPAETIIVLDPSRQGERSAAASQDTLNSPLWQQLPAFRNSRIVTLDKLEAFGQSGLLGYEELVEELLDTVARFR